MQANQFTYNICLRSPYKRARVDECSVRINGEQREKIKRNHAINWSKQSFKYFVCEFCIRFTLLIRIVFFLFFISHFAVDFVLIRIICGFLVWARNFCLFHLGEVICRKEKIKQQTK